MSNNKENEPTFARFDFGIGFRLLQKVFGDDYLIRLFMAVSSNELKLLEDCLCNTNGDVPLHTRFRTLFTLKSLKSDDAVAIISNGIIRFLVIWIIWKFCISKAFKDQSALLKHELAYCLGQMKNKSALPILESVLRNKFEDPMVRHEVRTEKQPKTFNFFSYPTGSRGNGRDIRSIFNFDSERIPPRSWAVCPRNLWNRHRQNSMGQLWRRKKTPQRRFVNILVRDFTYFLSISGIHLLLGNSFPSIPHQHPQTSSVVRPNLTTYQNTQSKA